MIIVQSCLFPSRVAAGPDGERKIAARVRQTIWKKTFVKSQARRLKPNKCPRCPNTKAPPRKLASDTPVRRSRWPDSRTIATVRRIVLPVWLEAKVLKSKDVVASKILRQQSALRHFRYHKIRSPRGKGLDDQTPYQ